MRQPWLEADRPLADRVTALVADLGIPERISLGLGDFTPLTERGLPGLDYVDSGTGLRGVSGATAFPAGIALAASFDPELAYEYGAAVGTEARAAGFPVLLGPTLDLARDPRGGRIPEALGEDPFLTGLLGAAHVRGAQDQHLICQVKHFVGYSSEDRRTGYGLDERGDSVDVQLSDTLLHDTYLRPVQAAVEAGAWSLMTSYNQLNGQYPSQNPALLELPRQEWGWPGFYCPDFLFAVRDPAQALAAGLDLGALGGPGGRTEELLAAEPQLLEALTARIVRAIIGSGLVEHPLPATGARVRPHLELAERVAVAGAVLLTNRAATLPLGPAVASLALIGPSGADALHVTGGSAAVSAAERLISPAAGVRAASGTTRVELAQGSLGDVELPPVPAHRFSLPDGSGPGIVVECTDADLVPVEVIWDTVDFAADPAAPLAGWPRHWHTSITPTRTGAHRFSLALGGRATLRFDGQIVLVGSREAERFIVGPATPLQLRVELTAGVPVDLEIDYEPGPAVVVPPMGLGPTLRLGWQEPDGLMEEAVALAARCDVAVVLATMASSEGMDRDSLALPGDQDELIRRVAATNPRTIVVLNTPGAVELPWSDEVAAILQVWYPGERFGSALAAMLFGAAEPGGRLPLTFPLRREDLPGGDHGPGVVPVRLDYDADGGIGYRAPGIRRHGAAFPFGHGLGYSTTTCRIVGTSVSPETVGLDLEVTNTGPRASIHVAQIYASIAGEAAELIGLARVRIDAGGSATTQVNLPISAFARWDGTQRLPVPGVHQVRVARDAVDPGQSLSIQIDRSGLFWS